jgi:hypothetical protein
MARAITASTIWCGMSGFASGAGGGNGFQPAIVLTQIRAALVVLNPGEMAPELDHGGQLAAFLEHLAEGLGCRLVDAEHGASMGGGTATGKR